LVAPFFYLGTLVKPATEDFVIQFVKNGMGTKNTDIFTWTQTSTGESDWLAIAGTTGSVAELPFTSTTLTLSTVGMEAGVHTHTKTFTFDTDDDSSHDVTVELTVDNVADPSQSQITWSHEESVREDEVLVLEIQAYDMDGFLMDHGGDKFKLLNNLQSCVDSVCTTDGEQQEQIFTDNGDGTYTLELIPDKTVDQYDMSLELNGVSTTFSDNARALKIETIDGMHYVS
jgi:hypothetical protein